MCFAREGTEPIFFTERRGPDQYVLFTGGVRTNICFTREGSGLIFFYTKEWFGSIYVMQRRGPDPSFV